MPLLIGASKLELGPFLSMMEGATLSVITNSKLSTEEEDQVQYPQKRRMERVYGQ